MSKVVLTEEEIAARREVNERRKREYDAIYNNPYKNRGYNSNDQGRPSSSWYLDEPFGRDQDWEPMNR